MAIKLKSVAFDAPVSRGISYNKNKIENRIDDNDGGDNDSDDYDGSDDDSSSGRRWLGAYPEEAVSLNTGVTVPSVATS